MDLQVINAIRQNDVSYINAYLGTGIDPDKMVGPLGSKTTFLGVACAGGKFDIVKEFLDFGADPNKKNFRECSPLCSATHADHPTIIKLLLQYGANINIRDKGGNTPLIIATGKGFVLSTKELLKYPELKPNLINNKGYTALSLACMTGHLHVIELLLKDPRVDIEAGQYTPLQVASSFGHITIMDTLIDKGADINKYNNGITPLMEASRSGQKIAVEYLLNHGADPYIRSSSGKLAYDYALEYYPEIARILKDITMEQVIGSKMIDLPDAVVRSKIFTYLFSKKILKKRKSKKRKSKKSTKRTKPRRSKFRKLN